jgi:cysteine desulfurase
VVEVGVDEKGGLDMAALEAALADADAALATFMWANNETGVVSDVAAIGALCRQAGVPLHVDGVQAVGKLAMQLRDLPVDLVSVSAHKFHGPKGIGALYVRRGVRWMPWVRGGPQERDRRGGTENVAGIVGMGVAAELARQAVEDGRTWARVAELRDRLEKGVLDHIPETFVNGDVTRRLGNTTNIGFAGLEAEAILMLLSERDICASAGAACASGSLEPSHVLRAMHLPDRIAHGAVRFSLSRRSTDADIAGVLQVLPTIIEKLRATLPV